MKPIVVFVPLPTTKLKYVEIKKLVKYIEEKLLNLFLIFISLPSYPCLIYSVWCDVDGSRGVRAELRPAD